MSFFSKKRMKQLKKKENELILTLDSSFVIQEAYKTLRTNIKFSFPNKGSKCIGVTSATQGNGKSTNVLNLAISFAQIGSKVILIDGDMRRPTVASKLNIPGEPGLSNFLVGAVELKDVVQHNEEHGIDVITSGTIPPDATVLLESEGMPMLIQNLKQQYDYVFIDLPPVLVAADVVISSKYVDGFLLVVRHGVSEYHSVAEMMGQLEYVDAHILGVVYASADINSKQKRYSHYGYYKK